MVLEENIWSNEPVTRVFAGISLGRTSRRLKVVLLRARGFGWQLRVQQVDGISVPPLRTTDEFDPRQAVEGLVKLSAETRIPLDAVDSLGLLGLPGDMVAHAHFIARETGLTTLCRFHDRAARAEMLPTFLNGVGDWFLLRSAKVRRWIVSLGKSLQVTVLPANASVSDILHFDAGPGCRFLDLLVERLSEGRYTFDPSGHFAVQGQVDEDLLDHWSSHPFLLKTPPRALDAESFGERFVQSSMALAREKRRGAKDLLCSANHFVARCLAEALRRFCPEPEPTDEAILVGGGVNNGLLRKLVEDTLLPRNLRQPIEVGAPDELRPAAHAALLSFMAMENLSVPSHEGGPAPGAALGTIIPGSSHHWDRWVCHLADRFEASARKAA